MDLDVTRELKGFMVDLFIVLAVAGGVAASSVVANGQRFFVGVDSILCFS